MSEQPTEIIVIVDRSGSMIQMRNDVIKGFNKFLKEQKELPGQARLTYVQFDTEYETVHDNVNIQDVPELKRGDYVPRGMTALLDAIGITFTTVIERLTRMPKEDRPKVIAMIITDGQENASQEYRDTEKVKQLVKRQQDTFGWEVMFLAADMDAVGVGETLNIGTGRCYNYSNTEVGTSAVYMMGSANVGRFRAGRTLIDSTSARDQVPEGEESDNTEDND